MGHSLSQLVKQDLVLGEGQVVNLLITEIVN